MASKRIRHGIEWHGGELLFLKWEEYPTILYLDADGHPYAAFYRPFGSSKWQSAPVPNVFCNGGIQPIEYLLDGGEGRESLESLPLPEEYDPDVTYPDYSDHWESAAYRDPKMMED